MMISNLMISLNILKFRLYSMILLLALLIGFEHVRKVEVYQTMT